MAVFTNRATLSYNNKTVNSNTVTGEVVDVLTLTKTAVRPVYSVNDIVSYVITVVNSGTEDIEALTLTDDLGAYAFGEGTLVPLTYLEDTVQYFINGTPAAAPTVTSQSPLVIEGLSVPAGGNGLLVYAARANEYAPPCAGGSITNTVTAASCGAEASANVAAVCEPSLSIDKAVSPDIVPCNGEINYTFTVTNDACCPANVEDNVVLSDTFDPPLTITSVTLDGTELTDGQYTYNEETGEFATVAGVITVPAATFEQDPVTGIYTSTPGTATVVITGTV